MNPRQAGAGDTLSVIPAIDALEMRPQRALLVADRTEVNMAGLGSKRRVARPAASTSAPMPRPVPGPRITCGPRGPKPTAPICFDQPGGIAGSDRACASNR